ncbi:MAG: hypothetical protein ACE5I7_04650 [Candidatus Binatia bacterium]
MRQQHESTTGEQQARNVRTGLMLVSLFVAMFVGSMIYIVIYRTWM